MPEKLSADDWHALVAANPRITTRGLSDLTGRPLGSVRWAVSRYELPVARVSSGKRAWADCHAAGMTAIEAATARGVTPTAAYMWASKNGCAWPVTYRSAWRRRPLMDGSDIPLPTGRGLGPSVNFLIFGAKSPRHRVQRHDGSPATWGDLAALENEAALEAYR